MRIISLLQNISIYVTKVSVWTTAERMYFRVYSRLYKPSRWRLIGFFGDYFASRENTWITRTTVDYTELAFSLVEMTSRCHAHETKKKLRKTKKN